MAPVQHIWKILRALRRCIFPERSITGHMSNDARNTLYHTSIPSLSEIRRPNTPVHPAMRMDMWSIMNAFLFDLLLSIVCESVAQIY